MTLMIFEENMLVRKNFFTYNGLIMRTGWYMKSVANKRYGLIDLTLFTS